MNDELEEDIDALVHNNLPRPMNEYLGAAYTPERLPEVVALLNVASKLVETAAYGTAGKLREKVVIDLFELSVRLDTQAKVVGGLRVS